MDRLKGSERSLPEGQQIADSIKSQVPVRRFGTATEVAKAILYFASDESAFAVGSEIMLDGGMGTL